MKLIKKCNQPDPAKRFALVVIRTNAFLVKTIFVD